MPYPEFNEPLNNWNVGNATNMSSMFDGCQSFNQVLNWDVKKVKSMTSMFSNCRAFEGKGLTDWDVGKV
jgi:surface protein